MPLTDVGLNPERILTIATCLTVKEAAAHVKGGKEVINKWVNPGHLPAYYPTGAGRLIIQQEDLDRFSEGFPYLVTHQYEQPKQRSHIIDCEYHMFRSIRERRCALSGIGPAY